MKERKTVYRYYDLTGEKLLKDQTDHTRGSKSLNAEKYRLFCEKKILNTHCRSL